MLPMSIAFLREPLIQFLLLGTLIFTADQYVTANRHNPHHIQVSDDQFSELEQIFVEGQGRAPSPTEMKKLIIKWAENEIFYREAISMGLDQGDDMIRNRVILKMRDILFNKAIVENPTDAELQEFFEFNRERYDTPARYDVEQFFATDLTSAEQANALALKLGQSDLIPETYQNTLRRYRERPAANLASLVGIDGEEQLLQTADRQWIALTQSGRQRLARIVQRHPAEPVQLNDVKSLVARDWKKFRYDIQLADQTKAIADRYSIQIDLSPALDAKMQLSIAPDELHHSPLISPTPAVQAAMN